MKSQVLAWVPRRQELVHHTPQDQSSTPGHPGAVVTSTSTSYFKFTHNNNNNNDDARLLNISAPAGKSQPCAAVSFHPARPPDVTPP